MQETITQLAMVATLACALVVGNPIYAQELSGNVAVTNNYVWRGVTQTDDQAAVQGGLDLSTDFYGAYLGTWASNVDFGGDDTGYEVDLYGGFAGDIESWGLGYDLGLIYYAYPVQDDLSFLELFASGSYKWLSTGVYVTVADEDASAQSGSVYVPLSAEFELPVWNGLNVSPFGGFYVIKDLQDYRHWGLRISKDAEQWGNFSVAYEQNDLDGGNSSDPRVVVLWTKEFGF